MRGEEIASGMDPEGMANQTAERSRKHDKQSAKLNVAHVMITDREI